MRTIILSIVTIFLTQGCTSAPESPTSAKVVDTKKVAQKIFENFNNHDWQAMANCYAPTATFLDPSIGQEPLQQTRTETIGKYKELNTIFPDINDSVTSITACGNKAIVEFISTGTAPNGDKLYLPICSVLTFEDGLVVKDFTYYDN